MRKGFLVAFNLPVNIETLITSFTKKKGQYYEYF